MRPPRQQLEFDFSDEDPTKPDFVERGPADDAYLRELQNRLDALKNTTTTHPGESVYLVAKAGPDAQQAMNYADQLVKLQRLYSKALQANELLKAENRQLQLQVVRLKLNMRR
jgi:hypothetical protein